MKDEHTIPNLSTPEKERLPDQAGDQTSLKVESAWEPPQKCLGKRVFCTNHVVATKQCKLQQNGNKAA